MPPMDMASVTLNRTLLKGIMDNNQAVRGRDDRKRGAPAGGYLTYRRSSAVTERVKQGYLARVEKAYGPKVAQGLRQFLATNDFVAIWAKGAAADGMRPSDLGDSLAEYWATNWSVATGGASTSPAQTRAIRYQIGPNVARSPEVRAMSDAKKQELAETLMLNLVVETIGAQAALKKGDTILIQEVRTQTAARFKQEFGVDLNALKVSNRGFERA